MAIQQRNLWALIAPAALALSACTTFVNNDTHPLHLDAIDPAGTPIENAECTLNNNRGTVHVRSGETVQVFRSRDDLTVVCLHSQHGEARARVISRLVGGTVGNVLVGGLIGLGVDHSSARGYSYPTWIRITFGENLVVDRANEQEGRPTVGVNPTLVR